MERNNTYRNFGQWWEDNVFSWAGFFLNSTTTIGREGLMGTSWKKGVAFVLCLMTLSAGNLSGEKAGRIKIVYFSVLPSGLWMFLISEIISFCCSYFSQAVAYHYLPVTGPALLCGTCTWGAKSCLRRWEGGLRVTVRTRNRVGLTEVSRFRAGRATVSWTSSRLLVCPQH